MKIFVLASIAILGSVLPAESSAAGYEFRYKLKPGEKWIAKEASEVVTEMMDVKSVMRSEKTVEYRVSRGPKKGWVTVTAKITSQTNRTNDEPPSQQNPLAGMTFKADMHQSGEIRNYTFTGGDPQMAGFLGPAMKMAIFVFPEFPEGRLAIGEDFDVVSKMETGGMQGMGSMQATMKITYTLEEVRQGLAYFSTKQRANIKATGMDLKDAGKGTAIFDLKAGMWIEHETRSKSQVAEGMGSGGSMSQTSKMTLEKAE